MEKVRKAIEFSCDELGLKDGTMDVLNSLDRELVTDEKLLFYLRARNSGAFCDDLLKGMFRNSIAFYVWNNVFKEAKMAAKEAGYIRADFKESMDFRKTFNVFFLCRAIERNDLMPPSEQVNYGFSLWLDSIKSNEEYEEYKGLKNDDFESLGKVILKEIDEGDWRLIMDRYGVSDGEVFRESALLNKYGLTKMSLNIETRRIIGIMHNDIKRNDSALQAKINELFPTLHRLCLDLS